MSSLYWCPHQVLKATGAPACCRLQHVCTMWLGQPIGTENQYACCRLQHAYTMQLGKDSEKYHFQADQEENLEKLRVLQVQHVQKNHIIDGPSCTSHVQYVVVEGRRRRRRHGYLIFPNLISFNVVNYFLNDRFFFARKKCGRHVNTFCVVVIFSLF